MIRCEVSRTIGRVSERIVEKTVKQIFKFLKIKDAEVSIAIVNNKTIKKLNKKYRGKDKATDVLSFGEGDVGKFIVPTKKYLGEIIISYQEVQKQAREDKDTIKNIFNKLLVHGILHLLGHEHEGGGTKAEKMFKLQGEIFDEIK